MLYYLKKNKNKTLDYSGKMTLFKVLYFQEKKFFSGNEYKSKGERGYGSGGEKIRLVSDFSSTSSVMR